MSGSGSSTSSSAADDLAADRFGRPEATSRLPCVSFVNSSANALMLASSSLRLCVPDEANLAVD
jgi:hypothetical protein